MLLFIMTNRMTALIRLMVYLFTLGLGAALIALAIIDFKTYSLPDMLTLPLLGAGILQALSSDAPLADSLMGAALGYVAFYSIEIGFKYFRGIDGLGRGDAKLLGAAGAWCGWMGLPFIVLIASGMGLMALLFPSFRKYTNGGHIPFGPFLALAIFCVWIAQNINAGNFTALG